VLSAATMAPANRPYDAGYGPGWNITFCTSGAGTTLGPPPTWKSSGTCTPSKKYPMFPGGAPRMKKYGNPLAVGVTPGRTSMARYGSASTPGISRMSRRLSVVDPPGARSPPTFTSMVFAASGVFGASGAAVGSEVGGEPAAVSPAAVGRASAPAVWSEAGPAVGSCEPAGLPLEAGAPSPAGACAAAPSGQSRAPSRQPTPLFLPMFTRPRSYRPFRAAAAHPQASAFDGPRDPGARRDGPGSPRTFPLRGRATWGRSAARARHVGCRDENAAGRRGSGATKAERPPRCRDGRFSLCFLRSQRESNPRYRRERPMS
jgi:hypothetical protein